MSVCERPPRRAGGRKIGTAGQHLLAEYQGCDRSVLDDVDQIRIALRRAAIAAGATVVAEVLQPFAPEGVSGVVVIEESHLSVHTWPEQGYAAVDFYTCGDCLPERAYEVLFEAFGAQRAELLVVQRGLLSSDASLRVDEHRADSVGTPPRRIAR